MTSKSFLVLGLFLAACGDDGGGPDASTAPRCDTPPAPFETGSTTGHADPLGATAGQARAGRIQASQLPASTLGLLTWKQGDFVLANAKVALVIEDVGDSDLYDPWGGRPVGLARVAGGALVDAADFGEFFVLIGPSTVATTSVTVMNDGSDGHAAVIRATGRLTPLPFLISIIGGLYFDDLSDIDAAIDYVLEPDAEAVDIRLHFASPRGVVADTGAILNGFMFTPRMPTEVPGKGFTTNLGGSPWVQLVDDDATSWAYSVPGENLGSTIAQSGFVGSMTSTMAIAACGVTDREHATIVIGGPGLDGLEQARARIEGRTLRTITGTVSDAAGPLDGFHVHATLADGTYVTRATTDASGDYTLHVPDGAAVTLTAYKRGWATATADVAAAATTANLTVPRSGAIHVTASDLAGALPARVQIMPGDGTTIPSLPEGFGERGTTAGRLHVAFPTRGDVTLPVPAGNWHVVVSRGYEYEIVEADVAVTAGVTTPVAAVLDRVVDTTGVQCGDFHIHTIRSNDAYDTEEAKLTSAVADGLELPVRTDHEWVGSFAPLIEQMNLGAWAYGIGSIEMTSFQVWGHMGVFPLDADATRPNAGAPRWETWPTADAPDREVAIREPNEVFAEVRQRPEAPVVIINHPTGGTEYFDYTGFDAATGLIAHPDRWDETFTLVEVFNDSGWLANRDVRVAAWFALLNSGRPVFAVGSSDSHGINSSPVGYPRTCIRVGTDTPSALTPELVRDRLADGHANISGGIYVDTTVGAARAGDTATGVGATAQVDVRVQAATWVDVDALDVVVDGVTVATVPITDADRDPVDPVLRFHKTIPVDVAATGGWVVVAAYGDSPLEPVHPGRIPFGVTNPIWLTR